MAAAPDRAPRAGGAAGGEPVRDRWAAWLLEHRFGGDLDQQRSMMAFLVPVREKVLGGARLGGDQVVLDVGCGDGLLGFAALEHTPPVEQVIFSDVSGDLVAHCRALAEDLGVGQRCAFIQAALPRLAGIADASVDVVMLRSVLIYVADKQAAFAGLRRVLRPGGRLSLFEPINSFGFPELPGCLWHFDVTGLEDLAARVVAARAGYRTDMAPMLGFDERDLLSWTEQAGFVDLRLDYEASISSRHPSAGTELAAFLNSSPNPLAPTYRQVLDQALEPGQQEPLLERIGQQLAGSGTRARWALSYLSTTAG